MMVVDGVGGSGLRTPMRLCGVTHRRNKCICLPEKHNSDRKRFWKVYARLLKIQLQKHLDRT